jgi:hypothetical protein
MTLTTKIFTISVLFSSLALNAVTENSPNLITERVHAEEPVQLLLQEPTRAEWFMHEIGIPLGTPLLGIGSLLALAHAQKINFKPARLAVMGAGIAYLSLFSVASVAAIYDAMTDN